MDDSCGEWAESTGVGSGSITGVVGESGWNLWVWSAGGSVCGICGCKEVYRFPPIVNLYSCICFWQSFPAFCSLKF